MTLQKLVRIHFYLITFVIVNFIITLIFSIGIHQNIIFISKAMVYLTGVILFFITIRPFKWQSLYFSVYLLSPLFIFLSWLADGIFGALLASIFFAIFYPPNKKFEERDYVFYEKFQGFLGSCCTYDIFHNNFFILQRKVGELRITEAPSFKDSEFSVTNNKAYLKTNMEVYDGLNQPVRHVDTTFIIEVK